jgi:hypothetical protein
MLRSGRRRLGPGYDGTPEPLEIATDVWVAQPVAPPMIVERIWLESGLAWTLPPVREYCRQPRRSLSSEFLS